MSVQLLWDAYRRQLGALEGTLEEWKERVWLGVTNLEAQLAGNLVLRVLDDLRHAQAAAEARKSVWDADPPDLAPLLLNVLRLVAQANGHAARYGPPATNGLRVEEEVGKVLREGLGSPLG